MCGFGWLVPAIPWKTIAWVWAYNLVWMVLLGGVRVARRAAARPPDRAAASASAAIVNAPLQPPAAG